MADLDTGGFKRVEDSGGFKRQQPPAPREEPPSAIGSFFRSLVYGGMQTMLGAEQLGFGLAGDTKTRDALGKKSAELQQQFRRSPEMTRHGTAAGMGEFAGAALPFAGLGAVGRPASALGSVLGGAARGAAGAATAPVQSSDYWTEKEKQLAIGGAVGAALPTIGGMMATRLPSQQNPMLYAEGLKRAFRPLFNFVMGSEERTVDGFDRTVARQALDPIGADVPKNLKGHALLRHVEDKISDAYDQVVPQMSFPLKMYRPPPQDLQKFVGQMSQDHQRRLNRVLQDEFWGRFDPKTLSMTGTTFQDMTSQLGGRAYQWAGSVHDKELGEAVLRHIEHWRNLFMLANPREYPAYAKANEANKMFARLRGASDATDAGRFTPTALIREVEKQRHDAWRGNDALLRYAQVGQGAVEHKLTGQQLLHLATRHGAIAEAVRGTVPPIGRAIKKAAPYAASPAGREAAEAYEANRRGDLAKVQRLANS